MAAKKFYAVASGFTPGIYDNWPSAQAQVKGYSGAVYKGFATKQEAKEWLKNPSYRPASRTKKNTSGPKSSTPASARQQAGEVSIYTDGGALNNPGPGGYGVVQLYNGERKELSGGFRLTTNNRMELMACIVALRELEYRQKTVTIYSDSKYVVNGISKGWAKNWRRNGWIKSDKKPAINPDLWAELLDLSEEVKVSFKWVKGHAGNPLNERCDELAVSTARRNDLPIDEGYQKET